MEEDLREFEQTLGVKLGTRVFVELPKDGHSDDNNEGFISSIDGEKTDSMSISEMFAKMDNAEVVCNIPYVTLSLTATNFGDRFIIHVTDTVLSATPHWQYYFQTIFKWF